jgi:hypothetical protein
MDQIEFADGFDRPDTLAFGLGAGQLAVVMVGALAAYSLMRSPLPPAIVGPAAVLLAATAAGLGWLRIAGRPALDWAVFAGLFWMRPRRGATRWELATVTPGDDAGAAAGDDRRSAGDGAADPDDDAQTADGADADADDVPQPADAASGGTGDHSQAAILELFRERGASPAGSANRPPGSRPPTYANAPAFIRPASRPDGAHRVTFFSLRGGTGRSTLATE